ncbi:MAG: hypothetical protein MSG64_14480 [Pyrinomonadaceae bacterium MAG19_C2-C3]|nr:hypothetical protein [Pyrinomonadaceae bacterium MAG19_C2-C3]
MKFFNKRNIAIGVLAFAVGIVAVAGAIKTVGASGMFQNMFETSVKGQIASFILDERGSVTGFVLSTGDQIRFGHNLGESIHANVKIGDELSAQGNAGTRSDYGRELRVRQLSANGQTYIETAPVPPTHAPKKPHAPRSPGAPHPAPRDVPPAGIEKEAFSAPTIAPQGANGMQRIEGFAPLVGAENAATGMIQTTKASGNARFFLVGRRGEVNGVILAGGEQFRIPPRIVEEIASATGGALRPDTQITVEGDALQTAHGTVIRPRRLMVGDKTFALGR